MQDEICVEGITCDSEKVETAQTAVRAFPHSLLANESYHRSVMIILLESLLMYVQGVDDIIADLKM